MIFMKGTNDAWPMCIYQCIINGWLFRAKLVKGDNSVRYKIMNANFEMLYTQNHRAHFNLNHYVFIRPYRLPLEMKLSRISQGKPMCIKQKPEVCIRQAGKHQNCCFKWF